MLRSGEDRRLQKLGLLAVDVGLPSDWAAVGFLLLVVAGRSRLEALDLLEEILVEEADYRGRPAAWATSQRSRRRAKDRTKP